MSSAAQSSKNTLTIVHKFGGTSVADAERYRHVARLLLARDEGQQVTVVSAMKGVTDALIELARMAGAEAGAGHAVHATCHAIRRGCAKPVRKVRSVRR